MRSLVGTFVLCCLSLMTSSAQQQPRVTGFFTDMRFIPGPGDIVGTEVWIVNSRGDYWAAVQDAEGSPERPQVVPVTVSGANVEFSTRTPLCCGKEEPTELVLRYSGTVSRGGLKLSINGNPPTLLKRQNSFWQ